MDTAGCVRCHRDIVEAYARTGMGRSFSRAAEAQGKLYHAASDRSYEIAGGKMMRYQLGPGGRRVNEMEKSIDYALGSGNHAKTFLHRNPDGALVELPVSWYSEKGGLFAMSPGYDRPDHEDFRRQVAEDCMFCHNAYPRKDNALPEGIDCQRCHGPASDHKALINPAKLSRERQMDVCQQCHLEPTSSPPPSVVRRPERRPYSYRPGEPLTDYAVYFEAGIGDRFEVAHQAYRLRKSACFLGSRMTCTTCHDPHRAQPVAHFIEVCKSCHASTHRASENCLDCHMWKRRSDDAPHVVMTDHYIQRRKPASFTSGEAHVRVPYFPDENPGPQYYRNGMKASKAGDHAAAIRWFRQAIQSGDNPVAARRELAASMILSGDLSGGAEESAKLPDDTVAMTNLGNAYLQLGRVDDAVRVLEKAPEEPRANNLLGLAELKAGDARAAESAFRRAINLQPDLAEANYNLGNLLAARSDYAEAAWYFGKAVAANPRDAESRHSYGLVLALTHDYRNARIQLEEALRLAPGSAEIRSALEDLRGSRR
ncbi:MAG TPA: tetratricopeptide repeat protein [Bryobacteraceae bacterium]|nr:tetratricopeptide repeat protein [Bryobacteraceae bacterium]